MKKTEKQQAIKLREKGYSLNDIAKQLNVSKSTASVWLSGVKISNNGILKLRHKTDFAREKSIKTNKQKKQDLISGITKNNELFLKTILKNSDIKKIICALLYWCEGSKSKNLVGFTNSDPKMMKLFINSLRSAYNLDESKFRILLHIHEYHNDNKQKIFWSKVTGINLNQFHKSYRKSHTGKNKKAGYQGCASLRYYDYKIALELTSVYNLIYKNLGD